MTWENIVGDKVRWFTSNVEPEAQEQVARTASMPFVRRVAVMPDVHFGRGSTVGTVVATCDAVIPACVGVDIGCGMIAVRTSLTPDQVRPHLRDIREGIERRVPLGIGPRGMNSRVLKSAEGRVAALELDSAAQFDTVDHMDQRANDWRHQLGSLGGGNHFIEVCVGYPWVEVDGGSVGVSDGPDLSAPGEVWVILHSGSRGVGNKTGTFWTKKAQKLARDRMYDQWLPDPDLAFLPVDTEEYHQYMAELYWCQQFALLNREEMMDRVLLELQYTVFGSWQGERPMNTEAIEVERINCHHNYVSRERHLGENLIVTRKGAIRAEQGDRGLIPGSMGARSYIVTGLGNQEALRSAPHGAGRRLSRTAARKLFSVEQVQAEMDAQGIEARVREAIVDEAPGAYKDIDAVMADASALVRPTHVLRQLVSVKGD